MVTHNPQPMQKYTVIRPGLGKITESSEFVIIALDKRMGHGELILVGIRPCKINHGFTIFLYSHKFLLIKSFRALIAC